MAPVAEASTRTSVATSITSQSTASSSSSATTSVPSQKTSVSSAISSSAFPTISESVLPSSSSASSATSQESASQVLVNSSGRSFLASESNVAGPSGSQSGSAAPSTSGAAITTSVSSTESSSSPTSSHSVASTSSSSTASPSTTSSTLAPSISTTSSGKASSTTSGKGPISTAPVTTAPTSEMTSSTSSTGEPSPSKKAPSSKPSSSSTVVTHSTQSSQQTPGSTSPQRSASSSDRAAAPSSTSTIISTMTSPGHTSTWTSTSTIIQTPQTTFSTPVSITMTDSVNGRETVSTPWVITTYTTSLEPDGAYTTITYVVANPTGVFSHDPKAAVHTNTFFNNHGAVTGVFLVVGIVAACLATCVFLMFRRRRSRSRRDHLRNSIAWPRPLPHDPFEHPRTSPSPPQMAGINWGTRGNLINDEFAVASPPRTAQPLLNTQPTRYGAAGVGAERTLDYGEYPESPFGDRHAVNSQIGIAMTSVDPAYTNAMRSAQSSPSLYPATMGGLDDGGSFYEQEMSSPSQRSYRNSDIRRSNPRFSGPPISGPIIARKPVKPLTPPLSDGSHGIEPPTSLLDQDVSGDNFRGQLKKVLSQTMLDTQPQGEPLNMHRF